MRERGPRAAGRSGWLAESPRDLQRPARPVKTAWDWLQILILPAVIAVAAFGLNVAQTSRQRAQDAERANVERKRADAHARKQRLRAEDASRAQTLLSYLEQMTTLMLDTDLADREKRAGPETTLARTLGITQWIARRRAVGGPRHSGLTRGSARTCAAAKGRGRPRCRADAAALSGA